MCWYWRRENKKETSQFCQFACQTCSIYITSSNICFLRPRKRVRWELASCGKLLPEVHHSEGFVRQRQTRLQEPQCRAGLADHAEEGWLRPEGAADYERGGEWVGGWWVSISCSCSCWSRGSCEQIKEKRNGKKESKQTRCVYLRRKLQTCTKKLSVFHLLSLISDHKLDFSELQDSDVFVLVVLFWNVVVLIRRWALLGFFLSLIFGPVSVKQIFH